LLFCDLLFLGLVKHIQLLIEQHSCLGGGSRDALDISRSGAKRLGCATSDTAHSDLLLDFATMGRQDTQQPSRTHLGTRRLFQISIGAFVALAVLLVVYKEQHEHYLHKVISTLRSHGHKSQKTTSIFHEHSEYQTLDGVANDAWDALLPVNGGFISTSVYNDSTTNGLIHDHRYRYGIAMFHQLHCLQLIRGHLQQLNVDLGRLPVEQLSTRHIHHLSEGHALHCLDYLRQVG
jgi:hypothetical protein